MVDGEAKLAETARAREDHVDKLRVTRVQPSYVQVAAQLRAQIISGQIPLGERLPNESDLSAMLGVSRSTTREAMRLLAAENLVQVRRGVTGGVFVVHPDAQYIEDTLGTAIGLLVTGDVINDRHVVETWQAIYPGLARLAASRRTAADVRELRRLSGEPSTSSSVAELTILAVEFHRTLIVACHNPLLDTMSRPLVRLGPERVDAPGTAARPFLLRTIAEHRPIAEAVADKDGDRAFDLMQRHFEPGREPRLGSRRPKQSR
jgi:DNA-binding FadR family transcriptional regulator